MDSPVSPKSVVDRRKPPPHTAGFKRPRQRPAPLPLKSDRGDDLPPPQKRPTPPSEATAVATRPPPSYRGRFGGEGGGSLPRSLKIGLRGGAGGRVGIGL